MDLEVKDNLCGNKLGKKQKLIFLLLKLSADWINKRFYSGMRVHVEVLSMCVIRYCIVIFYDSSSTAISENKILSWKKELHRNSSAIDWNNIYLLGLKVITQAKIFHIVRLWLLLTLTCCFCMFALGALGLTFKGITTNSKNHIFFFKKARKCINKRWKRLSAVSLCVI